MCALRLSHSGVLRTQWVGSRTLQKLQIIIIIIPRVHYVYEIHNNSIRWQIYDVIQ